MPDLLSGIKGQLDAMNDMYRAGYEAGIIEGKRQVYEEMKKELEKIHP